MTDLEKILFRLYTDLQFRNDVQTNALNVYKDYHLSDEDLAALNLLDLESLNVELVSQGGPETICTRRG